MAAPTPSHRPRKRHGFFDAALKQARGIRAPEHRRVFRLARALERFGAYRFQGTRCGGHIARREAVVGNRPLPPGWFFPPPSSGGERPGEREGVFPPWDISGNPFDLGSPSNSTTPRKVTSPFWMQWRKTRMWTLWPIQAFPPDCERPERIFSTLSSMPCKTQKPIALGSPDSPRERRIRSSGWQDSTFPVFPSPEKALNALFAPATLKFLRNSMPPRKRYEAK